jgi:cell division protein FtsB
MRLVALALAFLTVVIQYPLWLGKGGWLRVWELDRQVGLQKQANDKLRQRNGALDAEVRDLKQGFEAVEERSRYELGMIRQDEVFFQIIQPGASTPPPLPVQTAPSRPAKPVAKPAAKAPGGSTASTAATTATTATTATAAPAPAAAAPAAPQ